MKENKPQPAAEDPCARGGDQTAMEARTHTQIQAGNPSGEQNVPDLAPELDDGGTSQPNDMGEQDRMGEQDGMGERDDAGQAPSTDNIEPSLTEQKDLKAALPRPSPRADASKPQPPNILVAIGASAGGLEPLETFFETLPSAKTMAYVVITHLSPDFKSVLDEILSRRTNMPVHTVEEGMPLRAGEVYVIPPGKEMIVAGRRLYLSDREVDDRAPLPINTFLRAMAREWGSRSIAIILSGSGSDGAAGSEAIKNAGGYVIAQKPETAAFDSMPNAVIDKQQADEVLSPRDIGPAILVRALQMERSKDPQPAEDSAESAGYRRILQLIYGAEDLDFSGYKLSTIRRRISRRMSACNCATLLDYVTLLGQDSAEIRRLSDDLLIGVTQFFRDPDAFETLRSRALQGLVESKTRETDCIRVWIAGCATGEEAYSIAIAINEVRREQASTVPVQIFATDIRRDFLEKAGRGTYLEKDLAGLPAHLRKRYFTRPDGQAYQISPEIRKLVIFAPHDLMRDPPFTKVDIISCRNVLIYFNVDLQQRILALFNFALAHNGVLLLGPSESLGELDQYFVQMDPHWRLFRKASNRQVPMSAATASLTTRQASLNDPAPRTLGQQRSSALVPAYIAMLKRYGPPCALINGDRQIVHAIGKGRAFLRPPEGAFSLDILEQVDAGLRAPLATGIERCRREQKDIVFPDLALRDPEAPCKRVRLSINCLSDRSDTEISHFVVIFEPLDETPASAKAATIQLDLNDASREHIVRLEEDLKRTRESLQASIEEIETSNEELQSSNEELMASNEELQSTNEELSSVNEELHSINTEYLRQNEKLTVLHHDMESLLKAVDVGVIFVDQDRIIRRFTSSAERLFGLIAEDVGRNIGDLRTQFRHFNATAMIAESQRDGSVVEQEYQFEDGSWWLLRCAVHDAAHDGAGVVLAAFNIDRIKSAELEALKNQRRFEFISTLTNAFTLTCALNGRIAMPQPKWQAFTGQSFEAMKGMGWLDAVHPDDRPTVKAQWHGSPTKEVVGDENDGDELRESSYRLWHAASGNFRHVQSRATRIKGETNDTDHWFRVIVDVEDVLEGAVSKQRRANILGTVMAASQDPMLFFGPDETVLFKAPPPDETSTSGDRDPFVEAEIGAALKDVLGPDTYGAVGDALGAVREGEARTVRIDGDSEGRTLDLRFRPHFDQGRTVKGFVLTIHDRTAQRKSAEADMGWLEMSSRLINKIDDEVILFNPATFEITFANKRAELNLRYPHLQLIGKGLPDLLPEYSGARLSSMIDQRGGDRISTFLLRYDGTTYDAQLTFGTDVRADTKDPVGILISRDISEQTSAAAELRDRTADLATSNRDLEQFAFAISHDLKAPLRHITSFAGLLRKDKDTLSERNQELLDHIGDSAVRMRAMIESLLAYCRIQRKEQFTEVPLKEAAEAAISNLADTIEAEKPAIEGLDELPTARGDRSLLTMLFQNLIENALKYRGDDRPMIRFEARSLPDRPGVCQVAVNDNGIGIDEAFSEDVFQVFRRLHPADESGSTGIGLAACRRIVEIHRGRIWLDTSHTPGARFVFELPSASQAS